MDEQKVAVEVSKDFPDRWYKHWAFPLLPHTVIRQPDQWNTWRLNFHWLFVRFWTLDSPSIGVDVDIDTSHLGAYFRLPYCKFGVGIHIPFKLSAWLQKHTWRHAKGMR